MQSRLLSSRLILRTVLLAGAIALSSPHVALAALAPEAIDALLDGSMVAWEPVKHQAIWSNQISQEGTGMGVSLAVVDAEGKQLAELDAWLPSDDGAPELADLQAKAKVWLAAQLALGEYVAVAATAWKGQSPLRLPAGGGTLVWRKGVLWLGKPHQARLRRLARVVNASDHHKAEIADAYLGLGAGFLIVGVFQNTRGSAYIEGYNQVMQKQLVRVR